MTELKWEEGKMYQLRIDMADEFRTSNGINEDIFNLIGYKTFMVQGVDRDGDVTRIAGFSDDTISYWFSHDEVEYFDIMKQINAEDKQEIVVEWLEKLQYVMRNDGSTSEQLHLYGGGLMISTDICDVYGATNICDFINNRYRDMKSQAETKRKQELLDRRTAIELELAQINKELGE